jgi:hypothetical protein
MLTDLERDLRDALIREAADVELPAPEWAGARPPAAPRRSRRLVAVAAAAVAAAGLGSLWLGRSSDDVAPADQPDTTAPAGVQALLQPVALDDLRWAPVPFVVGPVRPGSFRAYAVDGQQFVVFETIEHRGGSGVVEVRCVENEATTLSCRPIGERPLAISAFVSVWTDLPTGTDFVTARTAEGLRWQRPIDGVAAFTTPGSLQALDSEGRVLARLDQDRALLDEFDSHTERVFYDSLGRDGKTKVAVAAVSAALRCLGDHDIAIDPRDPVRVDVPLEPVWNECLAAAEAAGAKRFRELGGRIVTDPADDPTWSEEAWRSGDVDVTCVVEPGGGESCRLHLPMPANDG